MWLQRLVRLLLAIYRHHARSIGAALDGWRNQQEKSLPIALLYIFITVICDDMHLTLTTLANYYDEMEKLNNPVNKNKSSQMASSPANCDSKIDSSKRSGVLIYRPMLKVRVRNPLTGQWVIARAMLDTGASYSIISHKLANKLALKPQYFWPERGTCFSGSPSNITYSSVQVELQSLDQEYTTPLLTLCMGTQLYGMDGTIEPMASGLLCKIASQRFGVQLTDAPDDGNENDHSCQIQPFDILLGQTDLLSNILTTPMQWQTLDDKLALLNTRLGWTLIGKYPIDLYKTYGLLTHQVEGKQSSALVTRRGSKEMSRMPVDLMQLNEDKTVNFKGVPFPLMNIKEKVLVVLQHFFCVHYNLISACILIPTIVFMLLHRFIVGGIKAAFATSPTTANNIARRYRWLFRCLNLLNRSIEHLTVKIFIYIYSTVKFYYLTLKPCTAPLFTISGSANDEDDSTGGSMHYRPPETPFFILPQLYVRLTNLPGNPPHEYVGPVLLDTGSDLTVIDPQLASLFGCKQYTKRGPNGSIQTSIRLVISSLQFGRRSNGTMIKLVLHDSPIALDSWSPCQSFLHFIRKRYGNALALQISGGQQLPSPTDDKFIQIILGCDVLSTVFFPSPCAPIQLPLQPNNSNSNLWLMSTQLGWTICGSNIHQLNRATFWTNNSLASNFSAWNCLMPPLADHPVTEHACLKIWAETFLVLVGFLLLDAGFLLLISLLYRIFW